jgi:GTP cyclohydrolase I
MKTFDNDLNKVNPKLTKKMESILIALGIDTKSDHFKDTPKRFIKALMDATEYKRTPEPRFTLFPNKENVSGIVMLKKLRVVSLCSHHLFPWTGYVTVAYIPRNFLIGASKFSRIIDWMSAFPSAQEIFTEQLAEYIQAKADPIGLMVVSEATHTCMVARGANEENSTLTYSAVRGVMCEPKNPREEALSLLKIKVG